MHFFTFANKFIEVKKIPHTYVIVFCIVVLAAFATWIIPGGEYVQEYNYLGDKEVIYRPIPSNPQSWQVFSALFDGFVRQAGIIAFILIIGGAFWIVNETKALDLFINSFLKYANKGKRYSVIKKIGSDNVIIIFIMVMFSVFGAVFGMSEETIAFVIVFVPLSISMGYDSITGVAMVFVAASLGFAGAILNPFTIGIAQSLSGLPLFSGMGYRLICWSIITVVGIVFVLRYAIRIKKNPTSSLVYDDDLYWRNKIDKTNHPIKEKSTLNGYVLHGLIVIALALFSWYIPLSKINIGSLSIDIPILPITTLIYAIFGVIAIKHSSQSYVLLMILFTIIYLIIGVMAHGWYIKEISTLFLVLGLASGVVMNISANQITKLFLTGAKDIFSAAFIVGLAGGIIIILENGKVIHPLLHYMANGMGNFGKTATLGVMYGIQTVINIFIPSGSAKAALTIPIMAPFSDLIGLSRQATVLAFQFGDGFTNMITPTSGVLIGVIGVARIPYVKWLKWISWFMVALILLGFLLLIPTVFIPLNGF